MIACDIAREIDWRDPLAAFAPLEREPYAALLHAGARAAPGWSFIAAFPAETLTARGGRAFRNDKALAAAPFDALRAFALERALATNEDTGDVNAPEGSRPAPFASGLAGFLGYEMGAALEPTGAGPASPYALPDMALGAYDAVAAFDAAARRAFVLARETRAADRLAEALGSASPAPAPMGAYRLSSNFPQGAYCAAVAAIIERIRRGDLFQANLARRLIADSDAPIDAWSIFQRLSGGDVPFGAFLRHREGAIVSHSPERFFTIYAEGRARRIRAEPIKGTRPRGADRAEDERLAAELLADPKERAENVMIADLLRNDLSRTCRDGSIREEAICALASHATVHHLVSRISGELSARRGAVDALAALFPCGSVTGAPKVEAMKTIAELEGVGRGPYCGAIGYIDDGGGADFSVAIRTMIVEGARAAFPVGGGVTLRSDPQAEYLETDVKARAMLAALGVRGEAAA